MATADAWTTQEFNQTGCSKRTSRKAADESKPEAYPPGYVEDFDETRTQPRNGASRRAGAGWVQNEAVFNIRHTVNTILPKNLRLSICS